MTSFDALSREKQMQSLTRLGQTVLLHYGIRNSKTRFHSYSENIVLRVDSKESVGGYHTFALRIYNPAFAESEIEASTQWMQALGRHTDVIAPEPIPTRSGQLMVKEIMPGTTEQRLCGLFQWLEGECLDEALEPSHLRQVGNMTARMHVFSALQGPAPAAGLPEIDWETKFAPLSQGKGLAPNWKDHQDTFFSKEETRIIGRTARRVLAAIRSFGNRSEYGVIHGDLHQWNYMFHMGSVRVLDFDDSCFGSFAYDMAVTLWYLNHFTAIRVGGREKAYAYLDGYREIRDLPSGFNAQVGAYKIARHLQMMCWVLGWPRSDHIIPAQPFLTETVQIFKAYLDG